MEGADELNLAEFPLAVLSQRVPEGVRVLVFSDTVRLNRREVSRRVIVTGDPVHGLPTAADEGVLLALIVLSRRQHFDSAVVPFTRPALLQVLGWSATGQSYGRLARSLSRWRGVSLQYDQAWWDREAGRWVDASFHVLDGFTLPVRHPVRGPGSGRDEAICTVTWSEPLLRSFQGGNMKKLDLATYFKLSHATARRMFRYLDKYFYRAERVEFDLREFATEHIGLSRDYDTGKIKEKLEPSFRELEEIGFLARAATEQRYRRLGPGRWRLQLFRGGSGGGGCCGCGSSALPGGPVKSALAAALLSRGVSRTATREIIEGHPPEVVRHHLAVHDAIRQAGGLGIRNLPAYLVVSIRKQLPPPRELAHLKRRAAPAQVAVARAPVEEPDRRSEAARYLDGLSDEERARVEAAALEHGQPWLSSLYRRRREKRPDLARQFLKILTEQYVATRLNEGASPLRDRDARCKRQ